MEVIRDKSGKITAIKLEDEGKKIENLKETIDEKDQKIQELIEELNGLYTKIEKLKQENQRLKEKLTTKNIKIDIVADAGINDVIIKGKVVESIEDYFNSIK